MYLLLILICRLIIERVISLYNPYIVQTDEIMFLTVLCGNIQMICNRITRNFAPKQLRRRGTTPTNMCMLLRK